MLPEHGWLAHPADDSLYGTVGGRSGTSSADKAFNVGGSVWACLHRMAWRGTAGTVIAVVCNWQADAQLPRSDCHPPRAPLPYSCAPLPHSSSQICNSLGAIVFAYSFSFILVRANAQLIWRHQGQGWLLQMMRAAETPIP